MKRTQKFRRILPVALAASFVVGFSGCKPQAAATAPKTDQQIASDIQTKINGEHALSGQNIAVNVQDGRATLNGNTTDDASRALASNDAGSIDGVKTVINNLAVQPAPSANSFQPSSPEPGNFPSSRPQAATDRAAQRRQKSIEQERERQQRQSQQATSAPPSPTGAVQTPEAVRTVPAPPAAPPKPVTRTVTIPAGTTIPVRMTDTLDSATTQSGTTFRGSLANDLVVNGMVAAPRGSTVIGRVVDAKDAAHFKGSSLLSIELTTLTAHGQQVGLTTDAFNKAGAGRGKNTAEKTGVGAGVGAIIGALAGGGKGAAIGAAAGGGLGAGVNGVTRGQQVQIPSETLVNFSLRSDVTISTSQQVGGPRNYDSSQGDANSPRSYDNTQAPELQKRQ